MNFHGVSAVHQAQRFAMIADEKHRVRERNAKWQGPSSDKPESPSLAGYLVYVVTVIGFVIMCVSCALR